jgi:hypothetical protein
VQSPSCGGRAGAVKASDCQAGKSRPTARVLAAVCACLNSKDARGSGWKPLFKQTARSARSLMDFYTLIAVIIAVVIAAIIIWVIVPSGPRI